MRGLKTMLILCLAAAGAAGGAPAGAFAAGTTATTDVNAPFWTGHPDTAAFAKLQADRLARAEALIEQVATLEGARTIENTLRPLDNGFLELQLAATQASLIENVHPAPSMRTAAEEVSQKVSAFFTKLSLDRRLYDALSALDVSKADPETRHYVEKSLRDFRLAGVDRDEATRDKVRKLREELVLIGQEFDRNIRSGRRTITIDSAKELEGLPEDYIKHPKHQPGEDGKITLTTEYPDAIPIFSYAKNDALREKMYMAYNNRAFPENIEVLNRLIAKRDELAKTLGFANYAEYITADKMSGSAKAAGKFIDDVVAASADRAQREYQVLLARRQKDDPGAKVVTAWQSGYLAEQVRKEDYAFDSQSVRPYLPYDRVKQGVLDVTAKLFAVEFRRVPDAPVWHESVECWEMFDGGKLAGRFYLDMHPRTDKFSHAAQFDIRPGLLDRQIPEAALVCNFPGGEQGDPGLMEHGDVTTFFHEFGHLLHTMFAGKRPWVGTTGIQTEHDFVEAPSQMLEEWAWNPTVLATFAQHHETGEPIPATLVTQMKRAKDFGKGLGVRRQMVYAQISLSCYSRDPKGLDTDALVKEITARYQPFPHVEGTHLQAAFGHLEGYSAVYYTYMWSLVIAKDMFSQFDRKNLYDPKIALKYRNAVLAPGGSKPAAMLVSDFLGRPFNNKAWTEWLNEGEESKAAKAN
jgi:thimet oligopeptidase